MSKLIYTGIVKVKTSRALKFTFQDTRSLKGHNFFHRLEFTLRFNYFFYRRSKKIAILCSQNKKSQHACVSTKERSDGTYTNCKSRWRN